MRDFRLSDSFVEQYRSRKVDWGPLGEFTFLRTYSRKIEEENRSEAWHETVRRVVEGCFSVQKRHCDGLKLFWNNAKAQKSAQVMYDKIFTFKFLPPGRGLWMMGTKFVEDKGGGALNNPLHGDTPILTQEYGWIPIKEVEGQSIHVLTSTKLYGRDHSGNCATSIWAEASISSFEVHPTKKIVYESKFGDVYSVIASENHRWFRTHSSHKPWERVSTKELRVGDYLPRVKYPKNYKISQQGVQHGFFFGDGTRSNGELHQFGKENIDVLKSLFTYVEDVKDLETGVPHSVTRQCPYAWGEIPKGSYKKDKRYLYGFLAGYFAADGCLKKNSKTRCFISSARIDELEDIKNLFKEISVRTSEISLSSTSSNYKEERELYEMSFSTKDVDEDFFIRGSHKEFYNNNKETMSRDWLKIISIEDAGENEVYCATVPHYEQFVIEGFCLTSNCGFISTEDIETRGSFAFTWTMDALMLGVGIGFDTLGAGKITIRQPKEDGTFVIPDSREGWVESLKHLLDGYFYGKPAPVFDYSQIRPYGSPIKGFGGVASGPQPLNDLHDSMRKLLDSRIGERISSTDIVDLVDMIAVCVVSGNVRRSACLALGKHDDDKYVTMKDYNLHPKELQSHRWASNNSVVAEVGKTDYSKFTNSIILNGEPGIVWLENIRKFGRTSDAPDYKDNLAVGLNPCSEQPLENTELCCVTGDTLIQTKFGVYPISGLVGKEVEVWNGEKWSMVKPFMAGKDKDIYRVHLSDGSYLDCTNDHRWSVKSSGKRVFREIETKNLIIGSQNAPFSLEGSKGKFEPMAFEYGVFSGDGYMDGNRPMVCICGEKERLKEFNIRGKWMKPQTKDGYSAPYNRLSMQGILDFDRCLELNDKSKGLPSWVFEMDKSSILEFVAGLVETDGNVCHQKNTDNYRIFGNEEKMRDLQILLRRVGVNHATIYCAGEAGEVTNFGERNYSLFCCYIPSYECGDIPTRIKKAMKIGSRFKTNNAHKDSGMIDASRKQKITKIEKLDGKYDTYCFTEPETHMGVFGNVLTHQCLVETFPSRHESYDEYQDTLKSAYLYAKTVTLIPTHWPETNAILLKNRRIGLSQTGIIDAFMKHGRRNMLRWCDTGYKYIQDLDRIYSDWFCIPRSKRTTTVKPSGTTALLPGVSPGIHYPHAEHYIRRVRINADNPLVMVMQAAGYEIEDDAYGKSGRTKVISFPVKEKYFIKKKSDVTIWEQVKNVVDYQRMWSDNSVSVTVTFKKEEVSDIPRVLEAYEDSLKAISFLPLDDSGYVQMPYEEITKERYEEMASMISEPQFNVLTSSVASGTKYCDGSACEI